MKHFILVIATLLLSIPAFGQSSPNIQPPASLARILIGLAPSHDVQEIAALLETKQCFSETDERMLLSNGTHILGWINPDSPLRPQNDQELYALLEELEKSPAVRFAHPFVQSPNGALFGITETVNVKLAAGKSPARLQQIARDYGATSLVENEYIRGLYHLNLDKNSRHGPMDAAEMLKNKFEYVDLDYLMNPVVATNDPLFFQQWSLKNIGQSNGIAGADMSVEPAWTVTTGSPNVRIAIIDSGTDTTHPDLMPNLLPGHDATGGGSKGFPNTTYPNDAHGTNCAGIAAAKGDNNLGVAGVCYDCSVFPVKVFYYVFNPFGDPLPFSRGNDMADAISWAWQVGNADVMSNSWGITDNLIGILPDGTASTENAIQLALDSARGGKGIPMFFSSGNDGGKPIWPGRLAGCISVNATSMCDQAKTPASCDGQNWTGNWGDSLDVSAPGVRVASTDMVGTNGYDNSDYYLTFGGTSAACPNAAGVMGLVLSVYPGLTLQDARRILETACDKVGGYTYSGTLPNGSWSPELGHGRLNAEAAVQAAQISLANDLPQADLLDFQVYPNPAQNQFTIVYTLTEISEVEIELRDLQGKIMYAEKRGEQGPRSYKQKLTEADIFLRPGITFLTLKVSGHSITKKILIIK